MQERTAGEPANRLRLSIVSATQQAADILAVELAKAHRSPLAPFTARVPVDVDLRAGMPRQYPLCNLPSEHHRYVLAVLKGPKSRGGSLAMLGDERAPVIRDHDSMLRAGLPSARAALVSDG